MPDRIKKVYNPNWKRNPETGIVERIFHTPEFGIAPNLVNPEEHYAIYSYEGDHPKKYIRITNLDYPDPKDIPETVRVVCLLYWTWGSEINMLSGAELIDDGERWVKWLKEEYYYFINQEGRWQHGSNETLELLRAEGNYPEVVLTGCWLDNETYKYILSVALATDESFTAGGVYE